MEPGDHMNASHTKAVVVPVYNSPRLDYLDTLERRRDDLTTLIYGWQRKGPAMTPARMVTPSRIVKRQSAIPFFFSPAEQEHKAVTHAAVCGLIVHRDEERYDEMASWLEERRVERHCTGKPKYGSDVGTLYVVSGGTRLPEPIEYSRLVVAATNAKLSPEKRRGYTIVWLPEELGAWYAAARTTWDRQFGPFRLPRHPPRA
jgi:hypothetical protein